MTEEDETFKYLTTSVPQRHGFQPLMDGAALEATGSGLWTQLTSRLRCVFRSFLSSPAHVSSQHRPQLSTNLVSQLLRMGEDIGIGLFELRAPELSSIVHVNQFHVQTQLVIAPCYFSCGNSMDKQVLAQRPRVEVFVAVALHGAISQNWYARNPREGVDDSLDDALIEKLYLQIGFASEG